ncbi:MAG: sodium/proline symporter [Coriobacteriales bacterium]|jgi:sodium/proline symporter|nr:sodium/proline symporter [Coriobacteriales bacterium]
MSTDKILVLAAMIIYVGVIIGVGFYYAKRSQSSSEEFYLGGRKLGPWVAAMSAEASDMSGWLLMGLPGVAFLMGAQEAVWTAVGLAIGTYLNWLLVAKRLRKYSQVAGNSVTLPDFFSNRFHDERKILMSVAAIFILVFFSIYVGSCFVTTGKLFNSLFGWSYLPMMIVGALVVFAYTTLGGFLAESVSDFIQGVLMFCALIVVLVGGVALAAGIENVTSVLATIPGFTSIMADPSYLKVDGVVQLDASGAFLYESASGITGVAESFANSGDVVTNVSLLTICSTLAWGLGYFGMPQVLLRFMAIRKSSEVKTARRIAIIWCVISLFAAVCIGLVGRAVFVSGSLPGFAAATGSETIFIALATAILPAFIAGIMVSGIFAATMSSADSYMLIASSAIAKNFFGGLFKKDASDKLIMMVARVTMVVILVFGIIVALDENSSIFRVVSYAWAGFGATFGPLVILSLFWRRLNFAGALAGMVSGGAMVFIWHELIAKLGGWFAIYELLPAFVIGLVVMVVVSLLTKPPSEAITREFDTYMELDV